MLVLLLVCLILLPLLSLKAFAGIAGLGGSSSGFLNEPLSMVFMGVGMLMVAGLFRRNTIRD